MTLPTVIGMPWVGAVTEFAVQFPGAPYWTTPVYCAFVAQVTCTEVGVRSVR